ncbi:unnamed protein product, partial [Amoebophrya sp. A120]
EDQRSSRREAEDQERESGGFRFERDGRNRGAAHKGSIRTTPSHGSVPRDLQVPVASARDAARSRVYEGESKSKTDGK